MQHNSEKEEVWIYVVILTNVVSFPLGFHRAAGKGDWHAAEG